MKTKGVFSAKRRPFPFKQKAETTITMEGSPTEILKIKENEVRKCEDTLIKIILSEGSKL